MDLTHKINHHIDVCVCVYTNIYILLIIYVLYIYNTGYTYVILHM